MPDVFIDLDDNRQRVIVEPSFTISVQMYSKIMRIHTIYKVKWSGNRLSAAYTRGYRPHETLAAVLFALLEDLPGGFDVLIGNEKHEFLVQDAGRIAEYMHNWAYYTRQVQKLEQTIAEIDARAARYDEDVRRADQETKWAKQDFKNAQEQDGYGWYAQRVNEAVAERRLIATNRRCDPKRKLKAQAQLSQLEAEIRRLRPTFRKHVRPELRELI